MRVRTSRGIHDDKDMKILMFVLFINNRNFDFKNLICRCTCCSKCARFLLIHFQHFRFNFNLRFVSRYMSFTFTFHISVAVTLAFENRSSYLDSTMYFNR